MRFSGITRNLVVSLIASVCLTGLLLFLCRHTVFFAGASSSSVLPGIFLLFLVPEMILIKAGGGREPQRQVRYSMVVMLLNFLLPLLLAIVWFGLLKKNGMPDVILFFVVYLMFTIATVLLLIRSL